MLEDATGWLDCFQVGLDLTSTVEALQHGTLSFHPVWQSSSKYWMSAHGSAESLQSCWSPDAELPWRDTWMTSSWGSDRWQSSFSHTSHSFTFCSKIVLLRRKKSKIVPFWLGTNWAGDGKYLAPSCWTVYCWLWCALCKDFPMSKWSQIISSADFPATNNRLVIWII